MVSSGLPTPMGGAQSVSPSLLRSNSGMLVGQGGPLPSQTGFPSLVSPRSQFNNTNMLGNVPNVSSLLNQSFANGGPNTGLSGLGSSQRGGIDSGAESDPLSSIGGGVGFSAPSSFIPSNMVNPSTCGQVQGQQFSNASGNRLLPEQQQTQLEPQNFQHAQQSVQQFSAPHSTQQVQQQQQFQMNRGGLPTVGPVKMEPQTNNDQHGSLQQRQQPQQLQSLRNLVQAKLEPQQLQTIRNLTPVKMEPQHSDQSLFLHQQQQQQQQQHQFLHMSRQSSQAAAAQMNLLHQQRFLQLQQQHHQQQLLKAMPQQRSQLSQQFQQQNLPLRSPVKPVYEPGMCARRLTHYMYQQQHRPEDNNIEFWRKFVAEYFAPHAKKKWCVSLYGSGRQTTGVFPQDVWHCEICDRKPGRGFEATVEVLPRLFKIKYESGTLEELLYVDMPREYQNSSGQIVLDYAKAIQESVFEQLRVVRDGQLRIVFSPELKICSWEFCARRHEELIPRRLLIPQVSQLGSAAQKYQAATQNATNLSVPELQNNCNMFLSSARQLAKALEVPLVNDLGYTKRYVRCLQISEVVNSMKDLIDYSRDTGTGPMESLAKFPRKTGASSGFLNQAQQSEEHLQQQRTMSQNANSDQRSVQANAMQHTASNGIAGVNSPLNTALTSTSTNTVAGLIHQNSMNSRQQNSMNNACSPYGGNSVQIPSPGSSSTIPQVQPNPSPFQSPTPSSSNNLPQASHGALPAPNHFGSTNSPTNIPLQQPALSGDADQGDSHSSVQKIIHEMMMSSQLNGTSGGIVGTTLGNDVTNVNGIIPTSNSAGLNGGNNLVGHGTVGNSGMGSAGYNTMGGGLGQSAMFNGLRSPMGNNSVMNGRVGLSAMARDNQQQDLGNQLLSGLGAVNGFNNLHFDWKSSP
ncbi:SEUSS transcriptional co-regulator isoform 1 [Tripterygium wilfordii]|uniref:SEUSS transcriptional co-regulator isoform 1 n=1 Tax=Tripterygium wilfordii TaxID=458696 RepID=A0A7J7BU87_TRIWF|nr:transcriptional corepressor SEUSS-like [Tripterygium wilfordii]KAF5725285.1 SEUSS transcriptional co-regulator isoform 1 [Tripterygium wilfordii]